MPYKQIKINSLLNKITSKDVLFGGNYTIDSYQNCEFGCLYCDSSLDKTIYVKSNAADILNKELKKVQKGTIIVGSAHDPYQKAETDYKITRSLLEIIKHSGFSCHILTKSDLVLRDIDKLSEIENCLVTVSITSLKPSVSEFFEINVPSPKIRLQTIEELSNAGIKTGLAIIPVLPFLVEDEFENIIKLAKDHNANYILQKYLELKSDQKSCFIELLKEFNLDLVKKYEDLYNESFIPNNNYISKMNRTLNNLCRINKIKNKI